jgi:hypothetical protein
MFKFLFLFVLSNFSIFISSELIKNHLKITLFEIAPFCMKEENGEAQGFLVDLIQDLLNRVNTSGTQTVTYETYWANLENKQNETEIWDKVRQDLLSGEADMALVPLIDTLGWNGVIQQSQPYMLTPFMALVSAQVLGKLRRLA